MRSSGFCIEPTIFTRVVDPSWEIAQNEVFGPVLVITPFATDEVVILKHMTRVWAETGGSWTTYFTRETRRDSTR
ncbi:aldehyde dehydrogenase family protein [Nocardia sp. NPDC049220]|uniref:aldehyde dehydrogenase family protein n=1 Tax=Nocardia sp. NPDC049220 TaxID=3155273 RepID=UPI0033F1FCAD